MADSIVELPSYEPAIVCWCSHKHQHTKTYRIGAAKLNIVVIEGFQQQLLKVSLWKFKVILNLLSHNGHRMK